MGWPMPINMYGKGSVIVYFWRNIKQEFRYASSHAKNCQQKCFTSIKGCQFPCDEWTNINDKVLSYIGKNLHLQKKHPLGLVKQRIVDYFHKAFVGRTGNALFSVFEDLNPVVTVKENFDSLLIPEGHSSRNKSDCYYLNHTHLLRAHMTAHQSELIRMGLSNFLIIGDVYRRDEIDSTHHPVFHQIDGVRLCTAQEVFQSLDENCPSLFHKHPSRLQDIQEFYNKEASSFMATHMIVTLQNLVVELFGKDVKIRWVNAFFPFTHPSWELEVHYGGKWIEVLGCGIIEHEILKKAGATNHIGWAFGLGLERLAMHLYGIPDIRLFWSTDTGFLSQFNISDLKTPITYKPISEYPQCVNDISFWLPKEHCFSSSDFYDLVRRIGGETIEQVLLIDQFVHPKKQLTSHCYRIVYRHMERTLTQEEVNAVHKKIEQAAAVELNVEIR